MSSSNRTTTKGGKGAKGDKTQKTDKNEGKSSSGDKQQNSANKSADQDAGLKEKVKQVMEMCQRSEEEVCLALHECDYDLNQAINLLLENEGQGEWETSSKRKKNRQLSTSKQEKTDETQAGDDWIDTKATGGSTQNASGGGGGDKDKSRNKGSGPPRLHGRHNDSRGWRGREKQENERNLEEGGREFRDRRGRPGGSTRGGGGGRGRGGGRAGGRFPARGSNRGNRGDSSSYKPIDTWDNSNTWNNNTAAETTQENWEGADEWVTEEYTGSLADTKVFTPSVASNIDPIMSEQQSSQSNQQQIDSTINQQLSQNLQNVQLSSQGPANVVPIVGTLNAAQTQYLNQLQQQNSDNMKQYGAQAGAGTAAGATQQTYQSAAGHQQYSATNYAGSQQYGAAPTNTYVNNNYEAVGGYQQEQTASQPPTRTKQRARVPPPSKIPSSAVEMPGDLNNMSYLDVQFGALDFIDTNTFDSTDTSNKYNANASLDSSSTSASGGGSANAPSAAAGGSVNANTGGSGANLDLNSSNVVQNSSLDAYSPKMNTQNSISSPLTQSLSNTDSIPQQATEHSMSNVYASAAAAARNASQSGAGSAGGGAANAQANLDGMNKASNDSQSYQSQVSTTYNSYQKTNTYNSNNYNAVPQTTSSSSYNQAAANSYSQSTTGNYPSSNSGYPNTYSSTTNYQSNSSSNSAGFPSISQANSYQPSSNQGYQQNASQSVYSANAPGLSNSNFGNSSSSTNQYSNSYSSSANKLSKDSSYENNSSGGSGGGAVSSSQASAGGSSVASGAANNVTSSASLSISQATTASSNKTTTTTLSKNSSNVISVTIPPGVTPVMSTQYIMSQVPYFQQPIPYPYEDMQMIQQRLPHMTAPYYDMSYQTPTTLAAVRDTTGLGNVGYSISSDGRYARSDNNASPVPSTLSQQTSTLTQGHQAQPILAGTAPPYFFAAATPFNYQFQTMYTQLPTATNAHGTSNSNQYPKPATYGSGYGTYDALSQTQDYSKSGYVGNAQGQKGNTGNASSSVSTGNDLTAMYAKSHSLGKVNSYDKQGFHSATPPPFTGALHANQNAGLAPSGTGYPPVYIPTMTHQHSAPLMHQPLHQDSGNTSGQRSQASNQSKAGAKQAYPTSYWNQA